MRKFYFLLATLFLGGGLFGQTDLEITWDDYDDGDIINGGTLFLSATMRNSGTTNWPDGQNISLRYLDEDANVGYSVQNWSKANNGYITIATQGQIIPNQSLQSTDQNFNTTLPMDDAWTTFGKKKNINLCIEVFMGNTQGAPEPESNQANNKVCIDYTITGVTSLEEEGAEKIVVFPNPAKSNLNFNVGNSEVDVINVLDITGKMVDRITVNAPMISLDVNAYKNGVYFYEIMSGSDLVSTDKFTVSH